MMRYEAYKDSGVEWIGNIPEGWEVRKLKFLGKIYAGINGKKGDDFSKEYSDGIKSFIPFTNICNNVRIDEKQYQFVKIDENENQNRVIKNDILFLMSSETLDDIAKNSIYLGNDEELYLNSFCKGFRIKDLNTYPEFINYLFLSTSYRNYFSLVGRGFTRINLKQEFINDALTLLPPLPEQTAIAQFLDDKTAKIDQLIGIKQKEIELLKERRQILIQQAVTKGLDATVPMKDSGVEWIGEIPEHWEVRKVTYLFSKIGSGTTPTSGDLRFYDGNVNFLQTGDLNDGYVSFTTKTLKEKALKEFSSLKLYPKESLVIAMYGATIGKLGILNIETTTNQACCVLSNPVNVITKYFFFILLAFRKEIVALGYGGGQPNISQDLIKSLRFPIAFLEEQTQIVSYLEDIEAKIAKAIFIKEQEIEKLKEYKTVLIDQVVTGKVRVNKIN